MLRSLRLALVAAVLPVSACRGTLEVTPDDSETVLARHTIEAPDPGLPGPYAVRTLTYGSGTDRNRPEYAGEVSMVTESVDGSKLVDFGSSARARRKTWGFGADSLPLNGRVWFPEGEGPFPLVLVVHGNHDPEDYSDPGYDYLGELLASRGFILASIDMNFINGGIREENDARGWLLLQHLKVWRGFHEADTTPVSGKVDLTRIALMGHSRGGEAAPIAAAFNRLSRYPDDATLEFDFGFDIRAVVSIAPVDGQYLPTDRPLPFEDVSYLVFHGSHDGDVTSFHGLRLWDRLRFSGEEGFKSAIYMYRANHGQWNSVWNAHDNGPRSGRILDLRYLVPTEDQRRFAELYVTAFLEATLHGDERWLPLFRDHRVAGDWLPSTMYVTRTRHASFVPLADFEGDIDVTTGAAPGIALRGDSLATWREGMLHLRSSNRATTSSSQANQAVWLGWNNRVAGADTSAHGPAARYEIGLPRGWAAQRGVGSDHSLALALAPTDRTPRPRRPPEADSADAEETAHESNDEEEEEEGSRESRDDDAEPPPLDLTVEVEDAAGHVARVPLSRYGPIRRPLEIRILRRRDVERDRFANLSELVLQSYHIPFADLVEVTPTLDPARLTAVRLVFDRVAAGEVVVDDIGFERLPDPWWSARIR